MVQIGNEINNGMCGETLDDKVYSLIAAGAKAVRNCDSGILVAVHYTDPLTEGFLNSRCALLDRFKVDYDVIAVSYYPDWDFSTEFSYKKLTVK